jgi:hypothetical protein
VISHPREGQMMKRTKLQFKKLRREGVVQLATNVHTRLTGNPNVPTPNPSLPDFLALIDDATNASDEYEAALTMLRGKKAARDAADRRLQDGLRMQAATVEAQTGGDAEQILSTGFPLKSDGSPIGKPERVMNLRVTPSEHEGSLKVSWKGVRGAHLYEIAVSFDAESPTTWVLKKSSSKTRLLVNSFTSGQRVWLRVRAVGAGGEGAWSNPVAKIVP